MTEIRKGDWVKVYYEGVVKQRGTEWLQIDAENGDTYVADPRVAVRMNKPEYDLPGTFRKLDIHDRTRVYIKTGEIWVMVGNPSRICNFPPARRSEDMRGSDRISYDEAMEIIGERES